MSYTPEELERAKGHIRFLLRQAEFEELPGRVPMSPWLERFMDEATAQKAYEELKKEIQQKIGGNSQ